MGKGRPRKFKSLHIYEEDGRYHVVVPREDAEWEMIASCDHIDLPPTPEEEALSAKVERLSSELNELRGRLREALEKHSVLSAMAYGALNYCVRVGEGRGGEYSGK